MEHFSLNVSTKIKSRNHDIVSSLVLKSLHRGNMYIATILLSQDIRV